MYYYFSCQYPSAIKLNGLYFGLLGNDLKCINILPGEIPLVEICSLSGKEQTINFLPDENFLNSPPDYVSVTDMRGGFLINISNPCRNPAFTIIGQQKYEDSILTVFNENGVKISVDTGNDFFADNINRQVTSVEFYRTDKFSAPLVAVKLCDINILAVYLLEQKIKKVFFAEIESFSFDNGFETILAYKDMAKHKVNTVWELKEEKLTPKERTITYGDKWKVSKLTQKLLPFAFFEEIIVGGDLSDFVTEELLKNADKLKGYLGDFIGVMPPPLFRSIEEVGLIYPNGKNKYIVNYLKTEISENKIYNIKKNTI